ncbi:MAG TPA: hypothetical protein G4O04_06250 [Anaerolineae bacterium]|nr:hypothetical protein [Anaerolineae bacterium]HID83673.1 hypothetical protein [Anaerolineales bacterium]HIQ08589.1 hypothetical protein [Anaerolineaceae bacterium]
MNNKVNTPPLPTSRPTSLWVKVGLGIGALLVVALFVGVTFYLLQPETPTARIRDVFLIFLALEVFLIGLALFVLVVQLAILINLIQNEVKPILRSTQETVDTVRGTTEFLSQHLVQPVIKLNEYLAVFQHLGGLVRPFGKPSKKGE